VYAKIVPGTGVFSSERYLLSEKLPLIQIHFEDRTDDLSVEPRVLYSFVIRTGKKSFAVFAASEEEKSDWMMCLSNALSSVLHEQQTTSSEKVVVAGEAPQAPVWQDETERLQCPFCSNRFSLLNRKYHCRLCGCVVCANCSDGRVVVPAWGEEQLRCCSKCFAAEGRPGVVKLAPVSPRVLAKSFSGSITRISRVSKRDK
jgi:hypothetical protein